MSIVFRMTFCMVAAVLMVIADGSICLGAPINYGDFAGSTVVYQQVTEDTNTGDVQPLFGAPAVVGNHLDFDPSGFSASASGGSVDNTNGQLNFTLMSILGHAITGLVVSEGGDYSLFGPGTAATQVGYGISIATLKILEVDNVAVAPIPLAPLSVSGANDLINDPGIGNPWSLSAHYDIHAALVVSGTPFGLGATKVEISIDDTLIAISEASTVALVAKKDFVLIGATTNSSVTNVPEPSGGALLAVLAGCGSQIRRRRSAIVCGPMR